MIDPMQHLSSLNLSTSPSPLRLIVPESLQPFFLLSYPSYPSSHSHSHPHHAHPPSSSYTTTAPHSLPTLALLRSILQLSPHPAISRLFSYPQAIAHAHAKFTNTDRPGPSPTLYDKGPADVTFVLFCAIAFTVVRHVMMQHLFSTFSRWWLLRRDRGIKAANRQRAEARARARGRKKDGAGGRASGSVAGTVTVSGSGGASLGSLDEKPLGRRKREHAVQRFSEQAWGGTYAVASWSTGLLVLSRLPAPLSPESLWATYPITLLPGLSKFYYLAQLGWWFHQIYVINTEKRRADHWQMFAHHCLTIGLIVASYMGNLTRIGTVLHVFMDTCDILLCSAKCFRYLHMTTICDATFVAFLVTWLVSRQMGLPYLIYSSLVDSPRLINLRWAPEEGVYLSKGTLLAFVIAMTTLLAMCTVWFTMAIKVALRVVRGQGAEDTRSDDEEEEDDGEEESSEDGWGEEGAGENVIEQAQGQGKAKAKGKAHSALSGSSSSSATSGPSAGKTLSDFAEMVGCKRDTLKEESMRRRR